MDARRRSVESDLVVDVFFTNVIRGNDGLTPYIGENLNWWIGDVDTGVCAEGKDGKDGKDGATPVIGDNGNWWIDGVDQGTGSNGVPSGVIVMWSGDVSVLPKGWTLCNGEGVLNNGSRVPDLRGRFVVGYDSRDDDYSSIGNKGGEKKHKLGIDEMPNHKHVTTIPSDVGHHPGGSSGYDRPNGMISSNTDSSGGGREHENRPPYYVLAYIIKL